jgi:hypothetical protein
MIGHAEAAALPADRMEAGRHAGVIGAAGRNFD